MRGRVYALRRRGRRLPWIEVQNGSIYEGELSACYPTIKTEHFFVASLIAEPSNMSRVLPDLYEPVLVALGHDVLVLRGCERIGDGDTAFAVVQECSCSIDLIKEM